MPVWQLFYYSSNLKNCVVGKPHVSCVRKKLGLVCVQRACALQDQKITTSIVVQLKQHVVIEFLTTVFWDWGGVVHIEFLQHGFTID